MFILYSLCCVFNQSSWPIWTFLRGQIFHIKLSFPGYCDNIRWIHTYIQPSIYPSIRAPTTYFFAKLDFYLYHSKIQSNDFCNRSWFFELICTARRCRHKVAIDFPAWISNGIRITKWITTLRWIIFLEKPLSLQSCWEIN